MRVRLSVGLCRRVGVPGCKDRSTSSSCSAALFGACDAEWGSIDVEAAEGECGIITTLINRFNAENPDIHVRVNVVYWPGYDQLSAELAAGNPPDLVTMHESVISDYSQRHLIVPLEEGLRSVGIDPNSFTRVAREGVMRDGHIYALPFDNWAPLWHINMNLFRAAGMVNNGNPLLPHTLGGALAQARQFGKPPQNPASFNRWSTNRRHTREIFSHFSCSRIRISSADPRHIKLQTRKRVAYCSSSSRFSRRATTKNQDYTRQPADF